MKLHRDNIFKKYKWLREKNRPFIISSDYDGLICASFLNHYLDWDLVGYYDYNSIWLSEQAVLNKEKIIWVDLNILPQSGKSIGSHIVYENNEKPKGLNSSCNPNLLAGIDANNFQNKFPFSTILFLFWLHDIKIKNTDLSNLFLLHSDNTWMKIQKYSNNIFYWTNLLSDYNWDIFFKNVDSIEFEKKVDQFLYPKLINLGVASKFSKLKSNYLKILSRESDINPDWDTDVILKLFNMFADIFGWTIPELPIINNKINGVKTKINSNIIRKEGLNNFIIKNKIFSYAFTTENEFSYTVFNNN